MATSLQFLTINQCAIVRTYQPSGVGNAMEGQSWLSCKYYSSNVPCSRIILYSEKWFFLLLFIGFPPIFLFHPLFSFLSDFWAFLAGTSWICWIYTPNKLGCVSKWSVIFFFYYYFYYLAIPKQMISLKSSKQPLTPPLCLVTVWRKIIVDCWWNVDI